MFNRIMIYLALLGMALSALLSTASSTTAEFNATNESTKKSSNSIIDSFSSFCCMLSLFSFLLVFLHNFIIDCLISYETKRDKRDKTDLIGGISNGMVCRTTTY